MILLHERLADEAKYVQQVIEDTYKIPVQAFPAALDQLFTPIPEFDGYEQSEKVVYPAIVTAFPDTAVLILTGRDLYKIDRELPIDRQNQDDCWTLGYSADLVKVVATARMRRHDSRSSKELQIPVEEYLKRVGIASVHELGHKLVKAQHYKEASWVNAQTGTEIKLGAHCDDNTCVMYQIVDIVTPKPEEGHLLLSDEKRYDAGLAEQVKRIREDWFCGRCKDSLAVGPEYSREFSLE